MCTFARDVILELKALLPLRHPLLPAIWRVYSLYLLQYLHILPIDLQLLLLSLPRLQLRERLLIRRHRQGYVVDGFPKRLGLDLHHTVQQVAILLLDLCLDNYGW